MGRDEKPHGDAGFRGGPVEPLLILDANYLCHRAFHAVGPMFYGEEGTGAVFGVLRDIINFQDMFQTTRCVFVFDAGRTTHRHTAFPTYKSTRYKRHAEEPPETQKARADFVRQVVRLRESYLWDIGFRNIFYADGYEADDIIASIAGRVPPEDEAIVVASDQDLWQCIRTNVWCYNPHTRHAYNLATFKRNWYGLDPSWWPHIKALAGCKTDDIPGVPGVGEVTAARWVAGTLNPDTKKAAALRASRRLYRQNIKLTMLPWRGTPRCSVVLDEVTEDRWNSVVTALGMGTLRGKPPRCAARKSKGRKRHGTSKKGFGLGGSGGS